MGNEELAEVNGRLAQVVKIMGDEVTLQIFGGTDGIPTNAEVTFLGKAPSLKVSEQLAGRFFNAYGDPIDGGPAVEGEEREIGGPSVNPVRRKQPSELIATGIAGNLQAITTRRQIEQERAGKPSGTVETIPEAILERPVHARTCQAVQQQALAGIQGKAPGVAGLA